jgi:hypothetical protein
MSYHKSYRRGGSGGGSRWMALRYAGHCKVCGAAIPAGASAYWDSAARTVTCERIECAEADGLTEREDHGPAGWVTVRRGYRVDSGVPTVVVSRLNSGAVIQRNAHGRCVDAPCCGCCD